jgi:hypothetical protein
MKKKKDSKQSKDFPRNIHYSVFLMNRSASYGSKGVLFELSRSSVMQLIRCNVPFATARFLRLERNPIDEHYKWLYLVSAT